jgi:hypothetical protein
MAHVQREHVFQAWVDRFLDAVVLPPMWTTGINHENELTDNARARARARGVKPGVFDIYVCQEPSRSLWIECKWGRNEPSGHQISVASSLLACGIPRAVCWSMDNVLRALRIAGFKLHGNADNKAVEYQARAEAGVAEAELKAAVPKIGRSSAKQRPSVNDIRRAERARRLPL